MGYGSESKAVSHHRPEKYASRPYCISQDSRRLQYQSERGADNQRMDSIDSLHDVSSPRQRPNYQFFKQDSYGPGERMTYPSDAKAENRLVPDWRSQVSLRPQHPNDKAVECQRREPPTINQTSSQESAPERHHQAEPQRNCPLCPSVFLEP